MLKNMSTHGQISFILKKTSQNFFFWKKNEEAKSKERGGKWGNLNNEEATASSRLSVVTGLILAAIIILEIFQIAATGITL